MATGKSGIPMVTVRGALGNVVFQRTGDGLMVRERVTPRDPKTPAQMGTRAAIERVGALWRALSDAEFEAWTRYAEGQGGTAYRTFVGLTTRWLRVHPGGVPPTMPPAGPFFGDNVGLTIVDLRSTDGGEPASIVKSESSILSLTASQANAAGVVTEVLVQPLANARRKPRARDWKTAAFLTFADGGLTRGVALAPGAYSVAYRFVCAATGQATATAPLGAVTLA